MATVLPDPLSRLYLEHLEADRISANTIRARRRVLGLVGNAGTATREEVEAWWLTRADKEPATRHNDLMCLRAFYRWAARWEHRLDDPTARLDSPKRPNGLPRAIAPSDLDRLLAHFATHNRPLLRACALGAFAGLRVDEAGALLWTDVDLEALELRVMNGKGRKRRRVPMSPELVQILLPVVPGHAVVTGGPALSSAVFERRVNRGIQAALLATGSASHVTFHQLRHYFGTYGYRAVQDLVALRDLMGHESIQTTAIYAAAADDVGQRIAAAVVR